MLPALSPADCILVTGERMNCDTSNGLSRLSPVPLKRILKYLAVTSGNEYVFCLVA